MKLIDQVKPEVLKSLENDCKIQYSSSYRCIITSLENADRYKDLTIDQLQNLIIFLPNEFRPLNNDDWYFGDNILQEKYKL